MYLLNCNFWPFLFERCFVLEPFDFSWRRISNNLTSHMRYTASIFRNISQSPYKFQGATFGPRHCLHFSPKKLKGNNFNYIYQLLLIRYLNTLIYLYFLQCKIIIIKNYNYHFIISWIINSKLNNRIKKYYIKKDNNQRITNSLIIFICYFQK